jgi:carboxyl-terminal processing protease
MAVFARPSKRSAEKPMQKKNSKYEVIALLLFLTVAALLFTNAFVERIFAREQQVDVYRDIEPISIVLDHILEDYVLDAELNKVVEGALIGMMGSLDRHSSYISPEMLQEMREETRGEFEGIGVQIRLDEFDRIMVFTPLPESPAQKAGIEPFDLIIGIEGESTEGMSLNDAAEQIRGPRGTIVNLTIRRSLENGDIEELEIPVKRDKVPLESVKESRLLEDGIGYIRISDFKDNTADDIRGDLKAYLDQGMKAFILDLRWNPGGLLSASREACELFLPKNSLVTYTRGRKLPGTDKNPEDMELFTESRPVLPPGMPMIVLINEQTASSAEIVTGALQFHKRALVIGERTFGKGSVQTVIPLPRPEGAALRLTTALYYTPAGVSIDHQGILPDVEVEMTREQDQLLAIQLYKSYEDNPEMTNRQNHGSATGNEVIGKPELTPEQEAVIEEIGNLFSGEVKEGLQKLVENKAKFDQTAEDIQLLRAVNILGEEPVWETLLEKYHKNVSETQTAAAAEIVAELEGDERRLLNAGNGSAQQKEEKEEAD